MTPAIDFVRWDMNLFFTRLLILSNKLDTTDNDNVCLTNGDDNNNNNEKFLKTLLFIIIV